MTLIQIAEQETFVQAMDRLNAPVVSKVPAFALINGNMVEVTNARHTVDQNGRILGTVGDGYQVHNLRDPELVSFAQPIIDRLGAKVDSIRQWDSKVILNLNLPKAMQMELKSNKAKGDIVSCKAQIITSFDGSVVTSLLANLMRLACLNGMTVADQALSHVWKAKHTVNGYVRLEDCEQAASHLIEYFASVKVKFEKLIDIKYTDKMLQEALDKIYPNTENHTRTLNIHNNIHANFQGGMGITEYNNGTAWSAFNAFTQYLSHDVGVRNTRQGTSESELRSISNTFGGSADKVRQQAWQVINSQVGL